MKRLYLHVGTRGTGASDLQLFFSGNRDRLLQFGCCYPDSGQPHHGSLARALREGNTEPLLAVLDAAACVRSPAVLLSSEGFMGSAPALAFLRDRAPEVRIVLYLRRQDAYVQYAYQESVRSPEKKETRTFQDFYADTFATGTGKIHELLEWRRLVGEWADVFGKQNVIVRPCEDGQFAGGTLFSDFLALLGIDVDGAFVFPPVGERYQELSPDTLELVRIGNQVWTKQEQADLLAASLKSAAGGGERDSGSGRAYLSPADRIALLQQADDGNRWVAREMLGREDGRLFLEPWPDPGEPWQEYRFDFRTAVPPLAHLIALQRQRTEELSKLIAHATLRMAPLERDSLTLRLFKAVRGLRSWSPAEMIRLRREVRLIAAAGLVDRDYYRQSYPDIVGSKVDPVEHYVRIGWREDRNPSPAFNTRHYLAKHPSVAAGGRCPLLDLVK